MLTKRLSIIVATIIVSTTLGAGELKTDMDILAGNLSAIQIGFLSNDKAATLASLSKFQKDVKKFLGDKESVKALLPQDVKHKAPIALNSAELIDKNIDKIRDILNDRSMRMINQQMQSQQAFADIQKQCFRCHNLVRDWQ